MPRGNLSYLAFNRGLVSALGLARVDIKRLSLSAEEMTNWVTRVLGSMMLRPGLGYIGSTYNDRTARNIPFVFSISDKAKLELTNQQMRIWIADVLLERPAVATTITNPDFDSDLTGWTDNDEAGATSAWGAGGLMVLTGDGSAAAIRDQAVPVASAYRGIEHGLDIIINRGPVTFSVGSSRGEDDYISETELMTGRHHLALTPTGTFHIRFQSRLKRQVKVNRCDIEQDDAVVIRTPWLEDALDSIRYDQSGDVVFVACEGYQQQRIERRSARAWSVVDYQPEDGPFMVENTSNVTITPSGLSGNVTLAASAPVFKSTNVGGLYKLTSTGQQVSVAASAADTWSAPIRVTGVGTDRQFVATVAGTWAGTVRLQYSNIGSTGPWTDSAYSTTVNTSNLSVNDGLDNQIIWWRIGIKTGEWTSGSAACQFTYSRGSIDGVARITRYISSISVEAEVFTDFGGVAATSFWAEGAWSDRRGWPTCVSFDEGRLCWSGKNGHWESISDAFDSFDSDFAGDAGPISRTIGSGPVDRINWMLSLDRLILGGEGAEFVCRSSSLDEPRSPTNFNIKAFSSQGSSGVDAAKIDDSGLFVQRGGTRVFQIAPDSSSFSYVTTHLSALVPGIGAPGIVRIGVQRQPDTRVHFVRSDGSVALLVFDKVENVICWSEIEVAAGDAVEDVMVLPGDPGQDEDEVHYIVRRTVDGATVRYHEKWALESECSGGTLNKQLDAFVLYAGAATTTITGLGHLEGRTVAVWGNGIYLGTYTVSGGQITGLTSAVTSAVVGLTYTARWRSAKLAFATALGVALGVHKAIKGLGLVLANTHATGLRYGPNFEVLQDLPGIEGGKPVGVNEVRAAYDEEAFEFPGEWSTDARLCLQAQAPKPCTVLAAICEGEAR